MEYIDFILISTQQMITISHLCRAVYCIILAWILKTIINQSVSAFFMVSYWQSQICSTLVTGAPKAYFDSYDSKRGKVSILGYLDMIFFHSNKKYLIIFVLHGITISTLRLAIYAAGCIGTQWTLSSWWQCKSPKWKHK